VSVHVCVCMRVCVCVCAFVLICDSFFPCQNLGALEEFVTSVKVGVSLCATHAGYITHMSTDDTTVRWGLLTAAGTMCGTPCTVLCRYICSMLAGQALSSCMVCSPRRVTRRSTRRACPRMALSMSSPVMCVGVEWVGMKWTFGGRVGGDGGELSVRFSVDGQ